MIVPLLKHWGSTVGVAAVPTTIVASGAGNVSPAAVTQVYAQLCGPTVIPLPATGTTNSAVDGDAPGPTIEPAPPAWMPVYVNRCVSAIARPPDALNMSTLATGRIVS